MTIRLPLGTHSGIHVDDGLQLCMDDHALFWSQLQCFQNKYGASADDLSALIAERRWNDAEFLAHTLKGTAGMLGLAEVARTAAGLDEELKTACETGEFKDAKPALQSLRRALDRMKEGIQFLANSIHTT